MIKDRVNKSLCCFFFNKHPTRRGFSICRLCSVVGKEPHECVFSCGGEKSRNHGTSSLKKHTRAHKTEWSDAVRKQEEEERDRIARQQSTLRTFSGAGRSATGPPTAKKLKRSVSLSSNDSCYQ